jgi:hypothetical protein
MGSKLDVRKWLIASLAVFVLYSILQYFVQALLLIPTFPELFPAAPASQEITLLRLYTYVGRAVFSLMFVYIYTRGLEGKTGITEGIRYGFWIGLLIQVPGFFGGMVVLNQPIGLLLGGAIGGIIQYILCGIVANLLYKKTATA